MKLIVDCDEVWPVYYLREPDDKTEGVLDIPKEVYDRFWNIQKRYDHMQEILKGYYEERESRIAFDASQDSLWANLLEDSGKFY